MTRRRVIGLMLVALFAVPFVLFAQAPATSASKYAWDQPGPDLATVQGYTYKVYVDGATAGTVVTATCTGTASPFTCTAPIGAFTQGAHAVKYSAGNVAGESALSAAVTFTFVIVPAVPGNPRIQ